MQLEKMNLKQLQSRDIVQSLHKLETELRVLRMKILQSDEIADFHQKGRYISLRGVWKELQNVSDEEIEAAKKLWTVGLGDDI